jgi:hypothetical protein
MASPAKSLESKIHAERARFGSLALPPEFVAPNYTGRSIVNLATRVAQIFGAQMDRTPLDAAYLDTLLPGVRQVVLVMVDALEYQMLRHALTAQRRNGLRRLLQNGGQLAPLTSVFPSTTTAALTSLWTGYTPAEHGFVGYQLFLREYGARANMIAFSPAATQGQGRAQLVEAGLQPEKFLPVPTLPEALAAQGVPTYNLLEQPYVNSALGRTQFRGVRASRGIVTSSDLWVEMRRWLEELIGQRALLMTYWSAVDMLGHVYGPQAEAVAAEIDNFGYSFERELWNKLSPAARRGTLFLLTADHGMAATPPEQALLLKQHPEINDRLLLGFTGDARAAYLHCRQGQVDAVRGYFETRLADQFFVLDSQAALAAGLFGAGQLAAETSHRLGDLTVVSRGSAALCDRNERPKELGRHGGLLAEEMLVPLLAGRLDA